MYMRDKDVENRKIALANSQMCEPTKVKEATQLTLTSSKTHER